MNRTLLFIDETADGETSFARLKLKPLISASRLSNMCINCGQIGQTSSVRSFEPVFIIYEAYLFLYSSDRIVER